MGVSIAVTEVKSAPVSLTRAQAFHRTQTVCRPDNQAPLLKGLKNVGFRDTADDPFPERKA
jgi:hypothetical protein